MDLPRYVVNCPDPRLRNEAIAIFRRAPTNTEDRRVITRKILLHKNHETVETCIKQREDKVADFMQYKEGYLNSLMLI